MTGGVAFRCGCQAMILYSESKAEAAAGAWRVKFNCSSKIIDACSSTTYIGWLREGQQFVGDFECLLTRMSKSLRILVPVKRVIDYAVSLSDFTTIPIRLVFSIRTPFNVSFLFPAIPQTPVPPRTITKSV